MGIFQSPHNKVPSRRRCPVAHFSLFIFFVLTPTFGLAKVFTRFSYIPLAYFKVFRALASTLNQPERGDQYRGYTVWKNSMVKTGGLEKCCEVVSPVTLEKTMREGIPHREKERESERGHRSKACQLKVISLSKRAEAGVHMSIAYEIGNTAWRTCK